MRRLSGTSANSLPRRDLSTPPSASDSLLPELVNHPQYEVIRELGRGGMGVVYLARNKLMDRLEVLKVLNKEMLGQTGNGRTAFSARSSLPPSCIIRTWWLPTPPSLWGKRCASPWNTSRGTTWQNWSALAGRCLSLTRVTSPTRRRKASRTPTSGG